MGSGSSEGHDGIQIQRTKTVMACKRLRRRRQERANRLLCLLLTLSGGVASFTYHASQPTCRPYQCHTIINSSRRSTDDGNKVSKDANGVKVNQSAKDTAKNQAVSKDKAISALSQPNPSQGFGKSKSKQPSRSVSGTKRNGKARKGKTRRNNQDQKQSESEKQEKSYSSLLPPPTTEESQILDGKNGDLVSGGLSSWEDFLGLGKATSSKKNESAYSNFPPYSKNQNPSLLENGRRENTHKESRKLVDSTEDLPSITDLFPPDLYTSRKSKQKRTSNRSSSTVSPPPLSLDGVLPVSDLFYRSSQSLNDDDELVHEDDELPFSAEQSDQLTSARNRIRIRRNQAQTKAGSKAKTKPASSRRRYARNRKMVRRGMEMLVGGVPINADPPLRYVDLLYNFKAVAWTHAILSNSRDFGPMYHSSSVDKITKLEQALFCEHFVYAAMKWDICPRDLRTIVKSYTASVLDSPNESEDVEEAISGRGRYASRVEREMTDLKLKSAPKEERESESDATSGSTESLSLGFGTLKTMKSKLVADSNRNDSEQKSHLGGELIFTIGVSSDELEMTEDSSEIPVLERVLARGIAAATACTGFNVSFEELLLTDMDDGTTMIDGKFSLTLEENEQMSHAEMEKKAQRINSSLAQAMDDGDMQLAMAAAAKEETGWPKSVRDRVVEEFLFDDDDGDGPLYDVGDDTTEESNSGDKDSKCENRKNSLDITNDIIDEYDGPFGMPGSKMYHQDDIFLGGGNDGVFWDYSKQNIEGAPYKGNLGLRLVEATEQRAKERHPRVIAVGDVHGCIDELQDLLRECDYRPGDMVVFLGDLVSKGPDSISVVQMAREIGAIGVRGNHDFEVVRWHQAIKSGVDPPLVGSEHFHIASCLSKADMKWMYSLPWYISSKELGALFVHAGFVSGIRLAKQNPRLMMNMRSILPDGTVTSKFFNNWPWARLWDGPQTVLFGHDADRGLQQYEHAIGLDTGCVYGGRLTACILPEKRLVSVSARREYFKYRRKHYD
eukprot:scaffold24294_cov186-Cylindrotheca_fusiformis.AAC.2